MPRMRIDAYYIDPDTAESWLESHAANRPISSNWVKQLEDEMRNGRWEPNHQAINIDENGSLTDGQHRLWAIYNSEQTIPCVVSYCEDNKPAGIDDLMPYRGLFSNRYVDRGRARSVRDSVNITFAQQERRQMGKYESAAYGFIIRLARSHHGAVPVHMMEEMAEKFGDDYEALHPNLASNKPGLRKGAVVAGFILCRKLDPDKVDEAASLFRDGHGMDVDHPMFRLRESVIGSSLGSNREHKLDLLRTCNAICHHIDGRKCRHLKCAPSSLIRAGKVHGWDLSSLPWLEDFKPQTKETP